MAPNLSSLLLDQNLRTLAQLQESINLADNQHGFRIGRLTLTALQGITGRFHDNLNKNKLAHQTVIVAIDLSKAPDTVDHTLLLQDVSRLPLPDTFKCFLALYLRGRVQGFEVQDKKNVPKGGVLSPVLFNLYVVNKLTPPPSIHLTTYADNSTAPSSLVQKSNLFVTNLKDTCMKQIWFKERNLLIKILGDTLYDMVQPSAH